MTGRTMLGILALVAAACGDGAATTTTLGERPTTTAAPTTTTTTEPPAETTTSSPAATTTTIAIVHFPEIDSMGSPEFPPVLGSPGDPNGSGCVVPPGGSLPDGVWFGFVRSYEDGVIGLDLACFFTGEATSAAMAADGVEDEFEEGWYIRNQLPTVYENPVADTADVFFIDAAGVGGLFAEPLPLSEWPSGSSFLCAPPFDHCLVWLYVNGGAVTTIVEQFAP